jgi:PBS lyase HEAT-like repeat-containing protein
VDTTIYTSPVDKLLTLGKPESSSPERWPNYLELGLGPEHIPELIRMAIDPEFRGPEAQEESEEEDPDFWAPLHAIRALGQLHAEAAVEPLVNLLAELEDDEWMFEELPSVFGMIGPLAIPVLTAYLADSSHDMYSRAYASNGFIEIAKWYPESRDECIAAISKQLEAFEENDYELNAFIIGDLARIKAVETLPLIERAFKADRVDEFVINLDYVLEEFGLKEREVVESPFLELFKEITASRAKQKETPSPSLEESYVPPPARTTTDKIIKFSGKRVTKKKSKKKR